MKIEETRQNNIYNFQAVERYYSLPEGTLQRYYQELLEDSTFLSGLNERITECSRDGFTKGIFGSGTVSTVDWFAFQRVLLYALIRHLKPQYCLETGVYYGGNTAFMLNALYKNGTGTLVSIDLPDSKIQQIKQAQGDSLTISRHPSVGVTEFYEGMQPGFIIPSYLKKSWHFIEGSSLDEIPKLNHTFDFYIHDSDHSFDFLNTEISLALKKMSPKGTVVVDDINWSNAFFKMCVDREFFPVCVTDNGKGNLDVRTGLVYLNHPNNGKTAITGSKNKSL